MISPLMHQMKSSLQQSLDFKISYTVISYSLYLPYAYNFDIGSCFFPWSTLQSQKKRKLPG